ncbi:MAG: GTP-dependent dephospho-CoA kinase family protein [Haloferacaceae archaeon]
MLRLPETLRPELKEPLGGIYTDPEALLRAIDAFAGNAAGGADSGAGGPGDGAVLVSVGDVVTAHLLDAGRTPDVALVDGKTERRDAPPDVQESIDGAVESAAVITVDNPAATLSAELLRALGRALSDSAPAILRVRGEEDLAALPAVLAAPVGSSVVYGQPGEGMVHVAVTPETRSEVRRLLSRFEGDLDAALRLLARESSRD